MGTEQHRLGLCSVVNGSQIVIGTASCDWANQITTPAIFKVNLDGESTYSIGTVSSASKIILSAKYTGSTNSGLSYMINRSWTTNRGYMRIGQGDYDFADLLSQNTIDPIDEDISHIMTGNATVDGTISTSFGIDTDGNTLRIKSTNLSASRVYHFPDYNASIATKNYNPQLKTSNYQITLSDNMILASGNVTITLASASAKHGIRIGNRCLDSNASILVKKSGGDTIENAASLNLNNKYDTVYLIGDGVNTHFQF